MSKYSIYNSLLAFFIVSGLYNLPGCTVLVDVTSTSTSTGGTGENVTSTTMEATTGAIPEIAQLDCTSNWLGDIGCDKEEADLFCKILANNPTAIAKDFVVGPYVADAGLYSKEKEGVRVNVLESIYPDVYYHESNPYIVPTITLQVNCL